MHLEAPLYDVVIVGGGPAGLQAAMTLGRARRRVLVCVSGEPANAAATHSHNFFTRDGVPPLELQRLGREQAEAYPTVSFVEAEVTVATRNGAHFALTLTADRPVRARRVLVATGRAFDLPPLPGLAELWGKSVFTCPYCHGYEVSDAAIAIAAKGAEALHYAVLLRGWSRDLTIVSDGPSGFTDAERTRLDALGIPVLESPIAALETDAGTMTGVRLEDGSRVAATAMATRPPQSQRVTFPASLGATMGEHGVWKTVDAFGQSEVPGLYIAGDAAQPMQAIAMAVSSGMAAAAMLNASLATEDADAAIAPVLA
jgi:thioredoxin reductase